MLMYSILVIMYMIDIISGSKFTSMDCWEDREFVNQFDQDMISENADYLMAGMSSQHENHKDDRRFKWTHCRPQSAPRPINENKNTLAVTPWNEAWSRSCREFNAGNAAIWGISSWHDNNREDREWNIQCASLNGYGLSGCFWTDFINDFDQFHSYKCPDNGVVRSIESDYSKPKKDRRFRFECCRIIEYDFSNVEGYWESKCEGCDENKIKIQYGISRSGSTSVSSNYASALSTAISLGFTTPWLSGGAKVTSQQSQSVERAMSSSLNTYATTETSTVCNKNYLYQWIVTADESGYDGNGQVSVRSKQYLCTDGLPGKVHPECIPGECQAWLKIN